MAEALLTESVPQSGLHVCEVVRAGAVDGATVRVRLDACRAARTAELELTADDLTNVDSLRAAMAAKLGLPQRGALQQPSALFSPAGERLSTTDFLRSTGAVFLLIEGGQFIRPGVCVGHRQAIALENGQQVYAETISLTPLIFSVQGFLSPEECVWA